MKRGQSVAFFIVGIVVMIGLLGIAAWSFTPGISGQVVSEVPEDSSAEIRTSNYIAEPFQLRAWVVNGDGVNLNIRNVGDETFLVRAVEVAGCGSTDYGLGMKRGNSEIFDIRCDLIPGQSFSGAIIVEYSTESDTSVRRAYGNLDDVV